MYVVRPRRRPAPRLPWCPWAGSPTTTLSPRTSWRRTSTPIASTARDPREGHGRQGPQAKVSKKAEGKITAETATAKDGSAPGRLGANVQHEHNRQLQTLRADLTQARNENRRSARDHVPVSGRSRRGASRSWRAIQSILDGKPDGLEKAAKAAHGNLEGTWPWRSRGRSASSPTASCRASWACAGFVQGQIGGPARAGRGPPPASTASRMPSPDPLGAAEALVADVAAGTATTRSATTSGQSRPLLRARPGAAFALLRGQLGGCAGRRARRSLPTSAACWTASRTSPRASPGPTASAATDGASTMTKARYRVGETANLDVFPHGTKVGDEIKLTEAEALYERDMGRITRWKRMGGRRRGAGQRRARRNARLAGRCRLGRAPGPDRRGACPAGRRHDRRCRSVTRPQCWCEAGSDTFTPPKKRARRADSGQRQDQPSPRASRPRCGFPEGIRSGWQRSAPRIAPVMRTSTLEGLLRQSPTSRCLQPPRSARRPDRRSARHLSDLAE